MQMKNVNVQQNSEHQAATSSSVVHAASPSVAPPLPPRAITASQQLGGGGGGGRPLPGTPPSPASHQDGGCCDDPSHNCSPYKSVPVPKPIPPPYRQPPFLPGHQQQQQHYGVVGTRLNNEPPPPMISVPGSLQPPEPPNPVYITHSAKFPIKREPMRPCTQGSGSGYRHGESRIPHLADVVRQQQRPRSANTVAPEPRPLPRTQQAWTESKRGGGPNKAVSQEAPPWVLETARGPSRDDGEPLLMRSRSGPLYPLGIDNCGRDHGEPLYACAQPAGDVLYRAQVVTTKAAAAADQASNLQQGAGRLRDGGGADNVPLYGSPHVSVVHGVFYGAEQHRVHSTVDRLEAGETHYATRPEAMAAALDGKLHSAAGPLPLPPQQFGGPLSDSRPAENAGRSELLDDSVQSGYGQTGAGPRHRYYHLKDMVTGHAADNAAASPVEARADDDDDDDNPARSSKDAVASERCSLARIPPGQVGGSANEEEQDGCREVKRGAIYGLLRQQQQQQATTPNVKKMVQRFDGSISECVNVGEPADQKGAAPADSTDGPAPASKAGVLVSESGHGRTRLSSGGALNASFDSDVGGRGRLPSAEAGVEAKDDSNKRAQAVDRPRAGAAAGLSSRPGEGATECSAVVALEHELHQMMRKPRVGATAADAVLRGDHLSLHESTFSDSFSVTPPLPPLSPTATPPSSHSRSHSRSGSKYKLSLSAGNLHKSSGTTPDILETTRRGSSHASKDASAKFSGKKSSAKSHRLAVGGGSTQDLRLWNAKKNSLFHCRVPVNTKSSLYGGRLRGSQISLGGGISVESHDGEVTSTTTGLDMDSLLDDADLSTDDASSHTSQLDGGGEMVNIRRQLEILETMYSEVMKILGVKVKGEQLDGQRSSLHDLRPLRRKVFGSLTSLTGKGYHGGGGGGRSGGGTTKDRTGQPYERKRMRESKGIGRRFQRLESHVVTLARSVAHLSSEMRTQHIMFQELESLRQEVAQLHEQHQVAHRGGGGGAGAGRPNHVGGRIHGAAAGRDWDSFRSCIPSLTNPSRVKKLTKFFGDEPPLLRLFLKNLGYEKYAMLFEAEKIGIIELPYLTEERLQKIGIPMGPRMRILQEAQMSFRQEHFNIYIV